MYGRPTTIVIIKSVAFHRDSSESAVRTPPTVALAEDRPIVSAAQTPAHHAPTTEVQGLVVGKISENNQNLPVFKCGSDRRGLISHNRVSRQGRGPYSPNKITNASPHRVPRSPQRRFELDRPSSLSLTHAPAYFTFQFGFSQAPPPNRLVQHPELQAIVSRRTSIMSKDIEAGTTPTGYNAFASPKFDGVQDGESRQAQGASVLTLLLISIPRLAIQMTWSAQFAALGPYLGTMLPNYAVQLTQFIGPITGIFIGPIIGVFSDRSTSKWGRRRPFLMYASIASVVCWMLMGYTRQMGEALGDYGTGQPGEPTSRPWTTFFAIVLYAWMDVTVNVVQTPTYLFIADFAGDRQTLGSSIGQGWSLIGAIFVAGYIYLFGPAHKSLRWFLGMLSIVMMVTVIIACIAGKETPLEKDDNDKTSSWKQVTNAFGSIVHALKTLPTQLFVYCMIFFCVGYGYTAYNGNKGQFFGFEVYDGSAEGADSCGAMCTKAQDDYNKGVSLAGGSTDLMYNIVGYLYSWAIPFLVKKIGTKWVIVVSFIPQCLLMVMAFTKIVAIDVIIVVITSVTQSAAFALLVPIIIHVMGNEVDIGVYVGALNSAQCFGQLLNFAIGSALVETSFGYKLPVFLGGVFSVFAVVIAIFFFKLKMYTM